MHFIILEQMELVEGYEACSIQKQQVGDEKLLLKKRKMYSLCYTKTSVFRLYQNRSFFNEVGTNFLTDKL